MPAPVTQSTTPSRTRRTVSTLLILVGVAAGFYALQASTLPIAPLTGSGWSTLVLTALAIVWAQSISQVSAWTILFGFYLGLISVSFFAKSADTSYAITTWFYGAEQGVLGALLATTSLTRVRFWFLKKPPLRMGFILLIVLGTNLFFGYQQLSMDPTPFLIFSLTPVVAGLFAALLLWILRRLISEKKTISTPALQKNPSGESHPTPIAKQPKPIPSKQIKSQKKTQPPPPSKKRQKKKNKAVTTQSSPQKTTTPKTTPVTQPPPAPLKPTPVEAPKPLPTTPPKPAPKPTPTIESIVPAVPKPQPAPATESIVPPVLKPQSTPPNKPQASTPPQPAPVDSPSEQDDLSSAYDLLDRIKKNN